jgi:hypothetical protein
LPDASIVRAPSTITFVSIADFKSISYILSPQSRGFAAPICA